VIQKKDWPHQPHFKDGKLKKRYKTEFFKVPFHFWVS